ncbi:hypothetical protein [Spiroplasma endosymbiont of Labia minor]|uniref:hypothetical protein n=1 Tax=Spiroplasma endosymbiont of Labia minor TaxID=3066305 RepID=UPI0030D483C9
MDIKYVEMLVKSIINDETDFIEVRELASTNEAEFVILILATTATKIKLLKQQPKFIENLETVISFSLRHEKPIKNLKLIMDVFDEF